MKVVKINAIWCNGCLVMKKVWNEVTSLYPELEIVNYDYDIDEDIIKDYNVGNLLPVAIFYKNNLEVARLNGEKTKQDIIEIIESNK